MVHVVCIYRLFPARQPIINIALTRVAHILGIYAERLQIIVAQYRGIAVHFISLRFRAKFAQVLMKNKMGCINILYLCVNLIYGKA